MTKADLARMVQQRHGELTRRQALRLVDTLFSLIKDRVREGETVRIVRFGAFRVVTRGKRKGRNPMTGEEMTHPGRKAVVFRPSRSICAES